LKVVTINKLFQIRLLYARIIM